MKVFMSTLIAAIATVFASAAMAHGNVSCNKYPKSEWKPRAELQEKLTKEGWAVRRMESTPTCYEVYAKDPQGKRIEAFFDPKTFERVQAK